MRIPLKRLLLPFALVCCAACGRCAGPAAIDGGAGPVVVEPPRPMPEAVVVKPRTVESPAIHKVSFRLAAAKAAGLLFLEAPPKPPFVLDYLGGKGSRVSFELPYQCVCPCGRCVCPPPPSAPELGETARLQPLEAGAQESWDGRLMQVEWQEVKCPDGARGRERVGSLEPAPAGRYRATFNIARNPTGCAPSSDGKPLQSCAKISEVDLVSVEFNLPREGELTVDVPVPAK